ncbi:MAG TPA: DNA methyltransferase, partial [Leptospiraceae bacterium]|nr:DNA methyltransferase [Leptospiraceae bacterium]
DSISAVKSGSVDLIVTSPPFLDKVNYAADNWMKLWFLGIPDEEAASLSILPTIDAWSKFIHGTLREASRVLKKKANIVMEVGDVDYHGKLVNLDEIVINMSADTGLHWTRTYINSQKFTKLSNCWNISNNEKGTNSNRCVVLQKG